jgi:hypothetical protein
MSGPWNKQTTKPNRCHWFARLHLSPPCFPRQPN